MTCATHCLFVCLTLWLSGCTNPTDSDSQPVPQFLQKYPQNVQTLSVEGRQLRVVWRGDAAKRPLVFVHGSPGSWDNWEAFLSNDALAERFHLLAFDRWGYGGSQQGEVEPSLLEQAKAVRAVLETNRSGLPAILVGHSYGGPVIAAAAAAYPQRVGGLVFVAASVSAELEPLHWYQKPATWWPIRQLIPSTLRVCNEEILPLRGELTRFEPFWASLSQRVAIVHGDKDNLVPLGNADFLVRVLPKGTIVSDKREPGMNHFVPWSHPDLILQAIEALELK